MKLRNNPDRHRDGRNREAFSILEVCIAAAVVGVMFTALLSGLTSSFGHIQFGREELRATQIMTEKLDTIRLYRWDRINPTYISTNFTEAFFPSGSLGGDAGRLSPGAIYTGNIIIENEPVAENYKATLKKVTVAVSWKSGSRTIQNQMVTFISRHGLQKYLP